MRIGIESKKSSPRNEFPDIFLDFLYPDAYSRESHTLTMRTDRRNGVNIITQMTNKILLWTRMIRECDITVWTRWEVATILTDPGPSRTSTIIEECYFFSFFSRSLEEYEELMGNEGGMEEALSEMYKGNIRIQKNKVIRARLR